MSLVKYIETPTYFGDTGEQTVTPYIPYQTTDVDLTKQASEVSDFLKNLKAKKDSIYLHINALGAADYWGMNANGDVFPEEQLLGSYKTFEQYGNFYKHHLNKPSIGHKKYGKVLFAYYNPTMHRVELIAEVWKGAAPDIVADVADGKDVAVSMAIKVPYDKCTVKGCGNIAKTRGQYCSHGKTMLTKVLDDGQQVGRINPNGKFFDISKVFRPADRTGYVLRKVASCGYTLPSVELAEAYGIKDPWPSDEYKEECSEDLFTNEKIAQVQKLAAIEKKIDAQISADSSRKLSILAMLKGLDKKAYLGNATPCQLVKAHHRAGMEMSFPEYVKISLDDEGDVVEVLKLSPFINRGFSHIESHQELVSSYRTLHEKYTGVPAVASLIDSVIALKPEVTPSTLSELSCAKLEKSASVSHSKYVGLDVLKGVLDEKEAGNPFKLNKIAEKFGTPQDIVKKAYDLGLEYFLLKLESPLYKQASLQTGNPELVSQDGKLNLSLCTIALDNI